MSGISKVYQPDFFALRCSECMGLMALDPANFDVDLHTGTFRCKCRRGYSNSRQTWRAVNNKMDSQFIPASSWNYAHKFPVDNLDTDTVSTRTTPQQLLDALTPGNELCLTMEEYKTYMDGQQGTNDERSDVAVLRQQLFGDEKEAHIDAPTNVTATKRKTIGTIAGMNMNTTRTTGARTRGGLNFGSRTLTQSRPASGPPAERRAMPTVPAPAMAPINLDDE